MPLPRIAALVCALALPGGSALAAGEAPPPEAYTVVRPADNPLAKKGGAVPVPTITWEKVTVRPDHPRMLFTKETKAALAARIDQSPLRPKFLEAVEQGEPLACALMYQLTGRERYARSAIHSLLAGRITSGTMYQPMSYVFDWTYDAMTDEERREAIERVWATATVDRASGWPRCSAYSGYPEDPLPSETRPDQWPRFYNWTFHDQDCVRRYSPTLEAVIALAGHKPRAAESVRHYWEYSLKDLALFLDYLRDGSYWQGYYWSVTTRAAEIHRAFALMRSATGIDYLDPKAHPYLANLGRWILYCSDVARRRVIYNYGDGEMVNFDTTRVFPVLAMSADLSKDPRVEWLARQVQPEGADWFTEFFCHDPALPAVGPGDLPPARAFPGTGLAVMRTGWKGHDAWASTRFCDWFDMHGHPDAGSFILYCQSPLAPDTGFYCPGNYHANGYYTRTVAHNTITVRDPAAKTPLNDGCQRTRDKRTWSFAIGTDAWVYNQDEFDRANLLAFETQELYDYCAGEATKAYRPEMVKEFVRQTVLLRDGFFLVFDRVESPRAELEKRWLMHFVGEPAIDGRLVRAEVKGHIEDYDGSVAVSRGKERGVVRCQTLLPAQRVIRKIGGARPNIPVSTLCRVPRTVQRMGTGSRWEWTDPLILYYNDPLTGKKLGAICIGRETPTEAEYEINDKELYLKLHAYERGKTDEFRFKLADYETLLDLARDLGKRIQWHSAFHYLPGYEYYNEGVNYAPSYGYPAWENPAINAPELIGAANDAGSWRIEVYPAQQATRDYFFHVMRIQANAEEDPGTVTLARDEAGRAEAKVVLGGRTYLVAFNKTGDIGGHIRITDAAGQVLADRDFAKTIEQKD
ncbi:MAG TPA: heparinase II/III family protein [Planctomycetota bacterium]|nr:heparinase II/III family protein [Planctomycetota bacterium]HRR82551.1 heparinase II/III family protein [Planctomycetota bacterium]HRT95238.1 heparinase II/III family protein [Planctomycetota bacterium]